MTLQEFLTLNTGNRKEVREMGKKKKVKKTAYKNKETMTVTICAKSRFINPSRWAFKEAKKISKANPGMKVNFIAELDLTDEANGL